MSSNVSTVAARAREINKASVTATAPNLARRRRVWPAPAVVGYAITDDTCVEWTTGTGRGSSRGGRLSILTLAIGFMETIGIDVPPAAGLPCINRRINVSSTVSIA